MLEDVLELGYQIGSVLLFLAFTIVALAIAYYVARYLIRAIAQGQISAKANSQQRQQIDILNVQLNSKNVIIAEQQAIVTNSHKAIDSILNEYWKLLVARLTTQNFASLKKNLQGLMDKAIKAGHPISEERQKGIMNALQQKYEEVLKKEYAKQEQARIQQRIREEARVEAERQRELQKLENEELTIQNLLQRALLKAQNEHNDEVQRLQEKLAEAQSKLERAKSQAQLTKAGFIYVISNIGSFGEGVFKVGMTRRLEPMDRVRELGDASVPFPFDVHMMISCDNAPALEAALHRGLNLQRVNRVNFRKEYFRANVEQIVELVQQNHGQVDYIADPEAIEYRNSLDMEDEDLEALAPELEALTAGADGD
ncbi:hypothetical protein CVU37_07545 [candidate division BRC1 bacterium HGW-BRC1-1]|nr:MAG: hypothetical protein CVU37_07545 [candidate division BRC1 bacterium HGW-BRC1-1]